VKYLFSTVICQVIFIFATSAATGIPDQTVDEIKKTIRRVTLLILNTVMFNIADIKHSHVQLFI